MFMSIFVIANSDNERYVWETVFGLAKLPRVARMEHIVDPRGVNSAWFTWKFFNTKGISEFFWWKN